MRAGPPLTLLASSCCSGIVSTFLGDHSLLPPKLKYAMLGQYLMHPLSRGHIHITSADPFAAPDFDAAFLADEADLPPQVFAWKVSYVCTLTLYSS